MTTKLVYVHKLYQDNSIFIEFHGDFLFVKDYNTKKILHHGPVDKDLCKFLGVVPEVQLHSK